MQGLQVHRGGQRLPAQRRRVVHPGLLFRAGRDRHAERPAPRPRAHPVRDAPAHQGGPRGLRVDLAGRPAVPEVHGLPPGRVRLAHRPQGQELRRRVHRLALRCQPGLPGGRRERPEVHHGPRAHPRAGGHPHLPGQGRERLRAAGGPGVGHREGLRHQARP